jgi:hypothetical protein
MTSTKRVRTTKNSRLTNNVAASTGNNSDSAASPETPQYAIKQTKVAQIIYLIANAMKGTKLASLSNHIASLPKQLAMVIQKQASVMLELVLEMAQRTMAQERFDSQVVNPKTGGTEPFPPICCQLKNRMSDSQLLQDEDACKAILNGFNELIEKVQTGSKRLTEKVHQTGGFNSQETPKQ